MAHTAHRWRLYGIYGEYTLYRSSYIWRLRYGSGVAPALAETDARHALALFQLARLGFQIYGSGFRVYGLGFRVYGLGFAICGLGSGVWGSAFGV